MPNITSGNTNAPTQALARHGATLFVEDLFAKVSSRVSEPVA